MPSEPDAGRDALASAGRLGPFFELALDPADDGWTPFVEFASDARQVGASIARAVSRVAARTGLPADTIDRRAVASVWHLGIVARMVSPALGAAAISAWVPRMDGLLWRSSGEQESFGIRVSDLAGVSTTSAAEAAAAFHSGVVQAAVAPLTATTGRDGSVSELVLWGNVWSALAGAATIVGGAGPSVARAAADIARAVIATSPEALAGSYSPSGGYRRDTCCLYYRLPDGGLCGDCVLRPAGAPR